MAAASRCGVGRDKSSLVANSGRPKNLNAGTIKAQGTANATGDKQRAGLP
jgi:hypothetical protein